METLIRSLLAAVDQETSILNSLIGLGEEKRQYIIRNQYRELDSLVQKEGIVISGLGRAEDVRFKLLQELAGVWNLPVEQLSSAVLLTRIQEGFPSLSREAGQAFQDLRKVVGRLQNLNRGNQELLGYALDHVDYLWTILEGDTAGVYSSYGTEVDDRSLRNSRKMLDRKV